MDNFVSEKMFETNKKFHAKEETSRTPFYRQLCVACTCCTIYLCMGLMFGAPTVFIPQLRRNNITVTDDMASWLSSSFSFAAVPWVVTLIILSQVIGRKKICIFINLANMFANILFCFSTTPILLLITEICFGVTQAATNSVSIIIISEYTSPKYRGMFLCFKSACFLCGIWISNAIGIFTSWRYIPCLGFVISLTTLPAFFWPESPAWLASKNRINESRKAHRWLKGRSEDSERELEKLIEFQRETTKVFRSIKDVKLVIRKEFYAPLLLSFLAVLQYHFSGKHVINIYAIDILKKIVNSDSEVYTSMLILDGVTVLGAYIGCYINKLFRRRVILMTTSVAAISFLLVLSLYLYLVKLKICFESAFVSIFLLGGFSMSICSGPMIMASALYGELTPSRYKSVSIILSGLLFVVAHGTFLKLGPLIIKILGLPSTFLFYALSSGICTFLLYLYLPETKDKTLLEIEEYFRGKKETVAEGVKLVK